MEDMQIKLAVVWIALMLTYLLGDVLRIFSGDFKAGEISGHVISKKHVAGDCRFHGDPRGHGGSDLGAGAAGQPLSEHWYSRVLFPVQHHRTAHIPGCL